MANVFKEKGEDAQEKRSGWMVKTAISARRNFYKERRP